MCLKVNLHGINFIKCASKIEAEQSLGFSQQRLKKSSRHPRDFHKRDDEDKKSEKCVWSKIWKRRNYVELRDRWQKRGLSSLFTLACIYFSCTCSLFSFCIRLDDVFRYEEKLFKLSWSFQSSICHKVVILSGITDYFMTTKLKCYFWSYRITRNTT